MQFEMKNFGFNYWSNGSFLDALCIDCRPNIQAILNKNETKIELDLSLYSF